VNWRSGVRVGVAVVGLGVAAAVFVYSRRQPPPPAPPPDLPTLDPTQKLAGGPGQIDWSKKGSESVQVTFGGSRGYEDGRMGFDSAVVRGLGEHAFTLKASVLETLTPVGKGDQPVRFDLAGRFTFEASDGLVVESDRGSYDDSTGILTMPGAVTFRRARLSGTSLGAVFDRAQDTVKFLDQVTANVAPDPNGKGAAQATSKRMLLARGQHTLRLEENARIAGDSQVITGQQAAVVFSEDESKLKHLEVRGSARVDPVPGASENQPAMSADNLTMSFHPDGITMQHSTLTGRAVMTTTEAGRTRFIRASWIDFSVGPDGRTLTELRARDKVVVELPATDTTAGRTITSDTLEARGNEKKGLTSARFEGKPSFEEMPQAAPARGQGPAPAPKKRTGTARILSLVLGGQIDAIERAEFQHDAVFHDGRFKAEGDLAIYDEANDKLLLRPAPGSRRLARIVSTDIEVDAVEIDLPLEGEDIEARNDVRTRVVGDAKPGAPKTGSLFESGTSVFGTATTLKYGRESGRAVYTGTPKAPARLRQVDTEVIATQIEFKESTSYLVAIGAVDSAIPMSDSSKGAKPVQQIYRGRADRLTYDDTKRVAIYESTGSNPVVVITADGEIESRKSTTFELAKDSRTLVRMRSVGNVFGKLSGGHEVAGDVLTYRADNETYELTGKPAAVKSPEDSSSTSKSPPDACKKTTSDRLVLNRKTNEVVFPDVSQVPRGSDPMKCSDSLRPRK
jgi:hypothetical protein